MFNAIEWQDVDRVRALLANGANVQHTTLVHEHTPIHFAARSGNIIIMQMLLDARKEIYKRMHMICDRKGMSPLHHAVNAGRYDMAAFLLKCMPDELVERECTKIGALLCYHGLLAKEDLVEQQARAEEKAQRVI